jgi:hypothetical protein
MPYNTVCSQAENSVIRYLDRPGACQAGGCLPLPEYDRYGKKPPTPVPCEKACGVLYCSADCRGDAWAKHHKYLCVKLFQPTRELPVNPLVELAALCKAKSGDDEAPLVNPNWPLCVGALLCLLL